MIDSPTETFTTIGNSIYLKQTLKLNLTLETYA